MYRRLQGGIILHRAFIVVFLTIQPAPHTLWGFLLVNKIIFESTLGTRNSTNRSEQSGTVVKQMWESIQKQVLESDFGLDETELPPANSTCSF